MGDHARSLGAVVFFSFSFFLALLTAYCFAARAHARSSPPCSSCFLFSSCTATSNFVANQSEGEHLDIQRRKHRHDSHSHLHCSHSALASFLHNFLYPRRFHSPTPSSSNGVDFVSVHGYHLIVDVLKQKSECRPAHGENRVLNSWFKHR